MVAERAKSKNRIFENRNLYSNLSRAQEDEESDELFLSLKYFCEYLIIMKI